MDTRNSNPANITEFSMGKYQLVREEQPIGFILTGVQRAKDPYVTPHRYGGQQKRYTLSVGLQPGWLLNRK